MLKKILAVLTVFSSLFVLSGCGYNTMQEQDEAANAAWSEVLNQYQRRADLIPNLVNTVKGYAKHEDEVLTKVTEARSKVGSIQMTAEDATDPEKLKRFQQARLMVAQRVDVFCAVPQFSFGRHAQKQGFEGVVQEVV